MAIAKVLLFLLIILFGCWTINKCLWQIGIEMKDKITDMFEIFVFYPFKALCVKLFNLFTNIQDLSMVINLFMKSVLPQVVNNSLRTVWKQNLEKMNLFLQVLFSWVRLTLWCPWDYAKQHLKDSSINTCNSKHFISTYFDAY